MRLLNSIQFLACSFVIVLALLFTASAANAAVTSGPYLYSLGWTQNVYYLHTDYNLNVTVIDTQTNTVTSNINVWNYIENATNISTSQFFDYESEISVSPDGSKIYVAINQNYTVSVIDTKTNTVTAVIPIDNGLSPPGNVVGNRIYGIDLAVSSDGTKLYVTNEFANTIFIIDTQTNKVIATIPIEGPFRVVVNPSGTSVYVIKAADSSIAVINEESNTVIAAIPVGKDLQYGSASSDGSKVYVANDDGTVSVINTTTNIVTTTLNIPIKSRNALTGFAVSPDGSKTYEASQPMAEPGSLSVINATTSTVTAIIPLGYGVGGVAVNPDGSTIYVYNNPDDGNDGRISVIDATTNEVNATIPIGLWWNQGVVIGQEIVETMPVADFSANNSTGVAPLSVQFTNNSTGFPSEWEWNFGDGTANNTTVNTTHVYQKAGIYNVTLTAINNNGSSTIQKIGYIIVNTPIPSVSKLQIGGFSYSYGNSSTTSGIISDAKKASIPVAGLVTSIVLGWSLSLPWLSKLLEFVGEGSKEISNDIVNDVEVKQRKIKASAKKVWIFGLSRFEIIVGLVTAILFGIAFLWASQNPFSIVNVILFIVISGVSLLVNAFAHIYVADRYHLKTEYKFWTLGTIIMLATSILLHTVFAQPSRTLIDEEDHHGEDLDKQVKDKRKNGIIAIAGPLVSLSLFFVFLIVYLMTPNNELVRTVADSGMLMNIVLCVYGLMPFKPMDGPEVKAWNKWLWASLFFVPMIFYIALIIFVL